MGKNKSTRRPAMFHWHNFVVFRIIKEMFTNTGLAEIEATDVTIHWWDRALTQRTS